VVLEPSFSATMIVLIIGVSIFFVGGGKIGQILLWDHRRMRWYCSLALSYAATRINRWLLGPPPGAGAFDTIAVWQKRPSIRRHRGRIAGFSRCRCPSDYLCLHCGLLGFLGAVLLVVLCLLAYRLPCALNAPDQFATFMAVGITA
jgi:cell division protein FtsW (lipid II flippase)